MSNRAPTSDQPAGLQMTVPARAENVAVLRHAIAGLAETLGMDEAGIADLKTIVTEASMNVVVHAYDGHAGPLSLEAEPEEEYLTVIVRDAGRGFRPQADIEQPSLRLGLSLIAALSSTFSISGGLDRGTEVSMRVPLHGGGTNGTSPETAVVESAEREAEVVVGRSEFLGPVLGRLVGALAARREIPVDRLSDAILITDAIAAAAPAHFDREPVRLCVDDSEKGGIEIRLGPMEAGGGRRVREALEVPEVGGSLEALADELNIEESDDGDYLVMRFGAVPP